MDDRTVMRLHDGPYLTRTVELDKQDHIAHMIQLLSLAYVGCILTIGKEIKSDFPWGDKWVTYNFGKWNFQWDPT